VAFFKSNLQSNTPAAAAGRSVRLRGTLQSITSDSATIRTRAGDLVTVVLPADLVVNESFPMELSDIKAGTYVGVGGMPLPDGSQRAIGVTVFPESARGTNEGHYPYDFAPESTMTNATVADVAAAPEGRKLRLRLQGRRKDDHRSAGDTDRQFQAGRPQPAGAGRRRGGDSA
jgi:hypothetical protein